MKNLVLVLSALVMSSFVFTTFAKAESLDTPTLQHALQNSHATVNEKNTFAIVYGGQDISRGSLVTDLQAHHSIV